MGRIRKFFGLSHRQRWLLLKAIALLAVVRLLLWLLPYPRVRPLVDRVSHRSPRLAADPLPVESFVWAIEQASHVVPAGGHCLSRAVAARIFLVRRGRDAEIRYGVTRQASSGFIAHAWLESEGRILIGGEGVDRYTLLTPRTRE